MAFIAAEIEPVADEEECCLFNLFPLKLEGAQHMAYCWAKSSADGTSYPTSGGGKLSVLSEITALSRLWNCTIRLPKSAPCSFLASCFLLLCLCQHRSVSLGKRFITLVLVVFFWTAANAIPAFFIECFMVFVAILYCSDSQVLSENPKDIARNESGYGSNCLPWFWILMPE